MIKKNFQSSKNKSPKNNNRKHFVRVCLASHQSDFDTSNPYIYNKQRLKSSVIRD